MGAIFITATGTEIGKTFVAASLIRHWRRAGRAVDALKPVVSGYDPTRPEASDPALLLAALGRPISNDAIARIAPWRFAAPLAPDMAAHREGRALDFAALVDFCQHAARASDATLLIEGVGGVMAPLDERHTVLDLMTALKAPLLLVCGSYLGGISHTLTCLEVLQRRALVVRVLVVNETPASTVPLDDAVDTLARFARPVPTVAVPRQAGAIERAIEKIAELLP